MRWLYIAVVCLLVSVGGSQEDTEDTEVTTEDEETTTELQETTTVDPGPDPANPFKYYAEKQEKLVKAVSADVMEYVAPHFIKDLHELNITGDCTYGLLKFLFGLKKFRPWSIKSEFAAFNFKSSQSANSLNGRWAICSKRIVQYYLCCYRLLTVGKLPLHTYICILSQQV